MKLTKPGNYVKAKEAMDGEIVKFKNEGEIQTSERFKYADGNPQKSLVFDVEYKGEIKQLKVTAQSKASLIEAWGDETKAWVDKCAAIFVMPTQDGKNKTIFLKPVKQMQAEDINWTP